MVTSEELEVTVVSADRNRLIAELYQRRGGQLIGLARTLVDTREEAEEVVQEAFTRLVASFVRVDDLAKADRYVTVSVLNVARSRLRRRRTVRTHQQHINAATEQSTHIDHDADAHVLAAVRRAVATLPKRQQQCVVLQYFSNLTDQQIAATLGISAGSVKTHLSRGRAALAQQMEGLR